MKDSALSRLLRLAARPAGTIWLDGRAVTHAIEMETRIVPAQSFPNGMIVPVNITRVALGIMLATSGAGGDTIAPWPDITNFPFAQLAPGVIQWYNLKDYPGLIANAWYISPLANDDIMVIEVIGNPGVANV